MAITIRKIKREDAKTVSTLSAQLSYAITEDDTAHQIQMINDSANDVAYVAIEENRVIGWIHIFYTLRLESAPFCEVGGMVVDATYRSKGIGKILLDKAIEWSREKNCTRLVVRSNVKRKDAHHFYTTNGFNEIKLQKIFEKKIYSNS